MKKLPVSELNRHYKIYFDFDNTISCGDVLDEIPKRFTVDKKWLALEAAWQKGRIGSKECLAGQLRSVRVTRKTLVRYLKKVKIDPYFKRLYFFLKQKGFHPVILSDSFTLIIREVLKNNGLKGLPIYANGIRFAGDRLIPSFPYSKGPCGGCGNCKASHLLKKREKGVKIMFVGDGLSDLCAVDNADIVFAKETLLAYMKKRHKPCVPFDHLGNVYDFLKKGVIRICL